MSLNWGALFYNLFQTIILSVVYFIALCRTLDEIVLIIGIKLNINLWDFISIIETIPWKVLYSTANG